MMRLVEEGKVDLDAPVRRYLPGFAVADSAASAAVTVRQLLNHTSGWLGDDIQDFGRGDDALARYVASMTRLPQLSPPGAVFAYNNAGLVVAGGPLGAAEFEAPQKLQAGGESIAVESPGFAAPCWADLDGDGKEELLVGQFNGGKIKVYRHEGGMKFAEGEWLKAEGEVAKVPGVW